MCFRFIHTLLHTSARNTLLTSQEELQRCGRVIVQCDGFSLALPACPSFARRSCLCSLFATGIADHTGFSPPRLRSRWSAVPLFVMLLFIRLSCRDMMSFTSYRRGARGPSAMSRRLRGRTLPRSCRRPCAMRSWLVGLNSCWECGSRLCGSAPVLLSLGSYGS